MTARRKCLPRLAAVVTALAVASGCGGGGDDGAGSPDSPAVACPAVLGVGYRVAVIDGVKAVVWYPTTATETSYPYAPNFAGSVAANAEPTTCSRFPLVVFSHGLFGCGTQSIFLTETLARRGYVVVAPDHPDALCSVDGSPPSGTTVQEPGLFDPAAWNDDSYAERFRQVGRLLDAMPVVSAWAAQIDASRVGVAGHSLGGYTAFGIAGGWPRWRDDRVKAALLLSPYLYPYAFQGLVDDARLPLMFQGAQFDIGITPSLLGPTGIYAQANPPKYLVELNGGGHFEWTNLICASSTTVAACLQSAPNAALMSDYANAFFDRHLKDATAPLLDGSGAGLRRYERQLP